MKTEYQIGLGVVILAAAYYVFRKKTPVSPAVSTPTTTSTATFDRDKCAKEYAMSNFPKMKEQYLLNSPNLNAELGAVLKLPFSEVSIYNNVISQLNIVKDDSDASFVCNLLKSDKSPTLDESLTMHRIQQKYPSFDFEMKKQNIPLTSMLTAAIVA